MNNFKITFVENGRQEPTILTFTEEDIVGFDLMFASKFAYSSGSLTIPGIPEEDIGFYASINFTSNVENFNRLDDLLKTLNADFNDVSEVLIYRNDNLICDLTNVINISINASLNKESQIALLIVEGV